MENKAIELVIKVCREFNVRCHIVHLSSSEALDLIRNAKKDNVPLTVETCYHYLFFDSEDIPDGIPSLSSSYNKHIKKHNLVLNVVLQFVKKQIERNYGRHLPTEPLI